MLGRLKMSAKEAREVYLGLSQHVFAAKHRVNFMANLVNAYKANGLCDSHALKKTIKEIVALQLGVGHEEDLLIEQEAERACRT